MRLLETTRDKQDPDTLLKEIRYMNYTHCREMLSASDLAGLFAPHGAEFEQRYQLDLMGGDAA